VSPARVFRWLGVGVVVAILILQVVPYGRRHTNPPGRVEPRWDSPTTRGLQQDARLTAAETQALIAGLEATLGTKDRKARDD
jgi:hypothetical protein